MPPTRRGALNHIVAVVNDEVITRQELAKRYAETEKALARQKHTVAAAQRHRKATARTHDYRTRLQQHARSTGVRVDPAQVERAIQRIAEQNKVDVPTLQAALEKKARASTACASPFVTKSSLPAPANATSTTASRQRCRNRRLSANQGTAGRGDGIQLRHILVSVPENASPEQIQARAHAR